MLVSLILLAACNPWRVEPVAFGAMPRSTIGAPFSLLGSAGQTINSGQFRGRFLLIYFGYTECPDQCPLTMEMIAEAMRRLGPHAALVQPLFITIDPTRDIPTVVGQYVKLFSRRIIGLTGSMEAINRAETAFHVYVGAPDPKTGSIPHGSLLYVVGPHGRFRTALSGDLSAAALAVALNRTIGRPVSGASAAS